MRATAAPLDATAISALYVGVLVLPFPAAASVLEVDRLLVLVQTSRPAQRGAVAAPVAVRRANPRLAAVLL